MRDTGRDRRRIWRRCSAAAVFVGCQRDRKKGLIYDIVKSGCRGYNERVREQKQPHQEGADHGQ